MVIVTLVDLLVVEVYILHAGWGFSSRLFAPGLVAGSAEEPGLPTLGFVAESVRQACSPRIPRIHSRCDELGAFLFLDVKNRLSLWQKLWKSTIFGSNSLRQKNSEVHCCNSEFWFLPQKFILRLRKIRMDISRFFVSPWKSRLRADRYNRASKGPEFFSLPQVWRLHRCKVSSPW